MPTLVSLYVPDSRQLVAFLKDEVVWLGPANCTRSPGSLLTEVDTEVFLVVCLRDFPI